MPPPFVVDLTGSQELDASAYGTEILQEKFYESNNRPEEIHIGVLKIGIPSNAYTIKDTNYSFRNDTIRAGIENLLTNAIIKAGEIGLNCLVFPEYSIPRGALDKLVEKANTLGISLIGGLEYDKIDNVEAAGSAVIALPDRRRKMQSKHFSSRYEPTLSSNKKQLVFENSTIGNFAVAICSDYLELSVLNPLAKSVPLLDCLFVVACNPRPALYESLAISDATRLYAYVVVCNNCINTKDSSLASGEGSLVIAPYEGGGAVVEPSKSHSLTVKAGCVASHVSLECYRLSFEALNRELKLPHKGFMTVPASRKRSQIN